MGRQRLGGTRSKIRGKVGNTIYQIKTDGHSAVQYQYNAPESRTNPNTEAQARARMVMGQIQRMFAALPDIIKDAWVDAARGRMSFQKFAQVNRPLLMADVENHWDEESDFDWQTKYSVTPPAGSWVLADGALMPLRWDGFSASAGENTELLFEFLTDSYDITYIQFLQRLGMDRQSRLRMFFYFKYMDGGQPEIKQVVMRPNGAIPDSKRISRIGDDEFLLHDTEWNVLVLPLYGKNEFDLAVYQQEPARKYYAACVAFMITRETVSGTLFSSARFHWAQKISFYYKSKNAPADVWQSWLE